MRRRLLLLGVAVIFLCGTSYGADTVSFVPFSGVAVVGDTIYMHPLGGGDVQIGINLYNETPLIALSYPFIETCEAADLDPAKNNSSPIPLCFSGPWGVGRTVANLWETHIINMIYWTPPTDYRLKLSALLMMAPSLPPGDGLEIVLTFTLPSGSPDTCICLDTALVPPAAVLTHVNPQAMGYIPEFKAKCFHIKRALKPPCYIEGDNVICEGEATEFCAPPEMASYSWTGPEGFTANTQCTGLIDVLGYYEVTITDANGCTSTCGRHLIEAPPQSSMTQWGLVLFILAVAGFFGYMIFRRRRAAG